MILRATSDLDEQLAEIKNLVAELKELESAVDRICFLTINDVMDATHWSRPTVQNLFNRPDFPACDLGKEKVVELTALRRYFSVPRRKEVDVG